jgi:hypothetical protein
LPERCACERIGASSAMQVSAMASTFSSIAPSDTHFRWTVPPLRSPVKQERNRKSRDVSGGLLPTFQRTCFKRYCQNIKPEQGVTGPDTGPEQGAKEHHRQNGCASGRRFLQKRARHTLSSWVQQASRRRMPLSVRSSTDEGTDPKCARRDAPSDSQSSPHSFRARSQG